jgi:hypothetical protein
MVDVEVLVGVGVGVPVRVWVGVTAGVEVDVPVGCGVSVGITEGEGEIEEAITDRRVGVSDPITGSFEGTAENLWTGKLHEILRTIQIIPIPMIRSPGVNWFEKRFIWAFPRGLP